MAFKDARQQLREVNEEILVVEQQLEEILNRQHELFEKKKLLESQIKEAASCVAPSGSGSKKWDQCDFPWSERLEEIKKSVFKIEKFRDLQLQTMNATMANNDCILIMPTGGGKSLCFQLPALASQGITIVVTPLVSLMEDQVMALENLDVAAAMLNASSSKDHVKFVQDAMTNKSSKLKLIYVTPEKLAKSKRFMSKVQKMYEIGRFSRLAIDEVHCCSQWGHDFRPDYKFLGVLKRQFPGVPILGLTATATNSVVKDVQKILGITDTIIFRSSFNRHNLYYEVRAKASTGEANLDDIHSLITTRFDGQSGIVYCLTQKDSEVLAAKLTSRGIKACCYHANLEATWRSDTHKKWVANKIHVIVATIAFGMGIDKPDVRFVIHQSISKSMENYYQESGRAGRDDEVAYCILYYSLSDLFRQSTMVMTEQTGIEKLYAMIAYVINNTSCRRTLMAQHFGEAWTASLCNKMCDICKNTTQGNNKNEIVTKDITQSCKDIIALLNNAAKSKERVTGLKLLDAWLGKGKTSLRLSSVKAPKITRSACERIVAHLLLENYLKEDFHFTPYSTISYIVPGHRSTLVDRGSPLIMDWKCVPASAHEQSCTTTPTEDTVAKSKPDSKSTPSKPIGFINHKKSAFTKNVSGSFLVTETNSVSKSSSTSKHEKKRKKRPISDSDSDLDFGESSKHSNINGTKMRTKRRSSDSHRNEVAIVLSSDEN